jgi:glucosamine kinase
VAYYIGMDGGATKTLCAVGSETQLLATAGAGPSTLLRAGREVVQFSLRQSVTQACAAAGIRATEIAAACLGSTGAARSDVALTLHDMLSEILPKTRIQVCGDMEIALASAFGKGPGVVVVSGTGSIAFGRNAESRTARAGGLGPDTSDEGSGYWIGRRALAFLKNAETAASPAGLFPAVLAEVEAGNPQALEILAEAGAELARLGDRVCADLFGYSSQTNAGVHVAMGGGVFKHSDLVRRSFIKELAQLYPQAAVRDDVIEPVEGALWMARQLVLAEGTS